MKKLKLFVARTVRFLLPKFLYVYIFEFFYTHKIRGLLNRFNKYPAGTGDFIENRICYFISSLRPGGAERQLVNTVLGLAREKWDVIVGCELYETDEDRFYGHFLEDRGISVIRLGQTVYKLTGVEDVHDKELYIYFTGLTKKHLVGFEKSLAPYVLMLFEYKPQVVHAWLDQTNIRAGLAALIAGVPKIILSQRNVAPDNFLLHTPMMRPGYLALMKSSRVSLLNNSHGGAEDYGRWLEVEPEKIKVLHNGFKPGEYSTPEDDAGDFRVRYKIPLDAPVMGGVFRFYEEKQPLFWIRIARRVLDKCPEAYFILVGEGVLRDKAIILADKLKLTDRIRFTGLLHDPVPAIRAMNIFVLSSRKEGLPNVLIEAQGAGVPVLTPDVGGAAETLCEGKTGFAVKNATVSNMADKAVEMLGDDEWRESVKKYGPEFIADKFSMDKMIRKLELIYRE